MPERSPSDWAPLQQWWRAMGRVGSTSKTGSRPFFGGRSGSVRRWLVSRRPVAEVEYVLFVLVRYWIPVVLPPLRSGTGLQGRSGLLARVRADSQSRRRSVA
jgi:hypothetical protein